MMSIHNEAINNQLQRIIDSKGFRNSASLKKLLVYLVNATIFGKEKQLKAYTIGIELYSNTEIQENVNDNRVRIYIGRLRKTLEKYYRSEGINDQIIIEIPKGSYKPLFKEKNEVPLEQYKIRLLILPFESGTLDKFTEELIDNLSEDLGNSFIDFYNIEVLSYLTSKKIAKSNFDYNQLKKNYSIDKLIRGKVIRVNDQIEITVSLSDIPTKLKVWSKKFFINLEKGNIKELLREVSETVIQILGGDYGLLTKDYWESIYNMNENISTASQVIYEYRQNLLSHNPIELPNRITELEEALKREMSFAEGWAVLSEIYCDQYQDNIDQRVVLIDKARNAIHNAKTINGLSTIVNYSEAYFNIMIKNYSETIAACDRVLNSETRDNFLVGSAGLFIAIAGDYYRGSKIIDERLGKNLIYPNYFHHALMLKALDEGDFEKASAEADKFYAPEYFWSLIDQTATSALKGDLDKAASRYKSLLKLLPDFNERAKEYTNIFICRDNILSLVLSGLELAKNYRIR